MTDSVCAQDREHPATGSLTPRFTASQKSTERSCEVCPRRVVTVGTKARPLVFVATGISVKKPQRGHVEKAGAGAVMPQTHRCSGQAEICPDE